MPTCISLSQADRLVGLKRAGGWRHGLWMVVACAEKSWNHPSGNLILWWLGIETPGSCRLRSPIEGKLKLYPPVSEGETAPGGSIAEDQNHDRLVGVPLRVSFPGAVKGGARCQGLIRRFNLCHSDSTPCEVSLNHYCKKQPPVRRPF